MYNSVMEKICNNLHNWQYLLLKSKLLFSIKSTHQTKHNKKNNKKMKTHVSYFKFYNLHMIKCSKTANI